MREPDDIEDQLRSLVAARLGTQAASIKNDASLVDGLTADSLDLVGLIMEIEVEFHIDIPDEEAAQLGTMKELLDYVEFAVAANDARYTPRRSQSHSGGGR